MDRHEVPTHLDIEDQLFLGLTLARLFGVIATLGGAYGLYARFPWRVLPVPQGVAAVLHWAVPVSIAAFGLALVLARPAGRPLAAWAADAVLFLLRPRSFGGSIAVVYDRGETQAPEEAIR